MYGEKMREEGYIEVLVSSIISKLHLGLRRSTSLCLRRAGRSAVGRDKFPTFTATREGAIQRKRG